MSVKGDSGKDEWRRAQGAELGGITCPPVALHSHSRHSASVTTTSRWPTLAPSPTRSARPGRPADPLCLQRPSRRETIGRLVGDFVGPTLAPLQKHAQYDPQSGAIGAACTAAFLDYRQGELKLGQRMTYGATNSAVRDHWKWTRHPSGADREQLMVNSGVGLALALMQDVNQRVPVLQGYHDLPRRSTPRST